MENIIRKTSKRNRMLTLITVIVVVLVIIGGIIYALHFINQKNSEILNDFTNRNDTVVLLPQGTGYIDEETGAENKSGLRLMFTNSTEAYMEYLTMSFIDEKPLYQDFYVEDAGVWEFKIDLLGNIYICYRDEYDSKKFKVLSDDSGNFAGIGADEMEECVVADAKYNEYVEMFYNYRERFENIDTFKTAFLNSEYPFYKNVPHQSISWNSILEEVFENVDSFDIIPYDYEENGATYEGYRVTISGTYYQNPALDSYTKQYATSQGTYDVFVTSDNNSAVILQNEFESSSDSIDKAMYTYLALNVSNYYSGLYN